MILSTYYVTLERSQRSIHKESVREVKKSNEDNLSFIAVSVVLLSIAPKNWAFLTFVVSSTVTPIAILLWDHACLTW